MMRVLAAALVLTSVLLVRTGRGSLRRVRAQPPVAAAAVGGVVAGAALTTALLVTGEPVELPLVLVLGACGVVALQRRRAARRLCGARSDEVTHVCFAVAAELRAGRAPADAVAAAAAHLDVVGAELVAAAGAARLGAAVADEIAVVATLPGCERLNLVATAWRATDASGARIADLLDRLGSAFAADDAARAELQAHVAGPQATVVVLAALPVVAVAFGSAIGTSPLHFLLHTRIGWLLLVVAGGLDVVGVGWMRRITYTALDA